VTGRSFEPSAATTRANVAGSATSRAGLARQVQASATRGHSVGAGGPSRSDSTWTWRLTLLPGGGTRLVTRMKQDYRWETPGLAFFNFVLMEMGDVAMERRLLTGIKRRAESAESSR
jgi:hypothetical protein